MNKNLFKSPGKNPVQEATVLNAAGGRAYQMSSKLALSQFVATSCLNGTYYTSAQDQLETVKKLMLDCEPEFLGRLAIYGRQVSFMKDMPAVLCAYLASDNGDKTGRTTPEQERRLAVLQKVFPVVIDNGKMLRNFVQMIRSGVFGRKSFGTVSKRLIQQWFAKRASNTIFRNSIGNTPSLGEVIKMARPKPETAEKAALYAYLCGAKVVEGEGRLLTSYYRDKTDGQIKVSQTHQWMDLPPLVREYEAWKADRTLALPKLDFRMLDNEKLSKEQWQEIARNAGWLATLKNLNSYMANGAFDNPEVVDIVTERLKNPDLVKEAKAFPYQILVAYLASEGKAPAKVRDALHDALEAATKNVPTLDGQVYICPDVSGSMTSARVTGDRAKGYDSTGRYWDTSTTARCIDVAALVSASLLRTNMTAEIIPFEINVVPTTRLQLEARDTVMTNARKLSSIGGGGTNCSAPLQLLNQRQAKGDVVIFISDYESWFDGPNSSTGKATEMMKQWQIFKNRNPKAKLICIDLTPRDNGQVQQREDILQVGGFSDNVFSVIARFARGGWNKDFWVKEIEAINLDQTTELVAE